MRNVQERNPWMPRALALSLVVALSASCGNEEDLGTCTCHNLSTGETTEYENTQEKCDALEEARDPQGNPILSCSSDLNDHVGRSEFLNPFAMTAPTTW